MSDFWSRRRAGVEKEAQADAEALIAQEAKAQEAELAERSDEDILAELDLPEPETLDSADAVREFLSSTVPQRLKTRALRRLWRLNPVLANLDGLVDYGEDFTDSATVVENLQTAYQVGKGMLQHIEALAQAEAAKQAPADDATEEDEADIAAHTVAAKPLDDERSDDQTFDEVAVSEPVELTDEPDLYTPRPRRMTFTFDQQRTA